MITMEDKAFQDDLIRLAIAATAASTAANNATAVSDAVC